MPLLKKEYAPFQKEFKLIILTCKVGLNLQYSSRPNSIESYTDIDWERFLKMAAYHKIRPLVFKGLSILKKTDNIPDSVMNNLKRSSSYFALRNLINAKELVNIGALLQKHEVSFLPYKGIALSELAYKDIGIRESSDIDILFHQSDYKKLKKALINESYIEKFKVPNVLRSLHFKTTCEQSFEKYLTKDHRDIHIDAHWAIGPNMLDTRIDLNDIKVFYTPGEFFKKNFNVLTPDGLIITTVIHHGYSDGWRFLKNIADLAAILNTYSNSIDWEVIVSFCKKHRIINLLLSGLVITEKHFNIQIPESVSKDINRHVIDWCNKTTLEHSRSTVNQNRDSPFIKRLQQNIGLRRYLKSKVIMIIYHLLYIALRPFIKKHSQ